MWCATTSPRVLASIRLDAMPTFIAWAMLRVRLVALGRSSARAVLTRPLSRAALQVAANGGIAICSAIAPYAAAREHARGLVEGAGGVFVEIWQSTSLEVCQERDPKGLYKKVAAGEIKSELSCACAALIKAQRVWRLCQTLRGLMIPTRHRIIPTLPSTAPRLLCPRRWSS